VKLQPTSRVTKIKEALIGADMVFVTIGAGGVRVAAQASSVAEIARELVFWLLVWPPTICFRGQKRRTNADWAIGQLGRNVDTLITILMILATDNRPWYASTRDLKIADDVLRQGVQGISD